MARLECRSDAFGAVHERDGLRAEFKSSAAGLAVGTGLGGGLLAGHIHAAEHPSTLAALHPVLPVFFSLNPHS